MDKEYFIFKNKEVKDRFFNQIRTFSNLKWKDIIKEINVPKGSFDRYKSGKFHIPGIIFHNLLSYLPENSKREFLAKTHMIKPVDWYKKGGMKAYKINKKEFEKGRERGIIAIKKIIKKNEEKIKSNFELSNDLCEVVGAFIGDGFFNFYRNKLYHIEFSGDKRKDIDYYLAKIIPTIRTIIPKIKVHIRKIKTNNTLRVIFYSKQLFYILNKTFGFVPGKKAFTVFIPKKIMNSDKKFINSTIRGIFDTDGCVFFDKRKNYKKPYPRITLQIVSCPLFIQLRDYLSKYFKVYTAKNKNRRSYYLEIYGHNQLKKWMSEIGFSNKRHLERLAPL